MGQANMCRPTLLLLAFTLGIAHGQTTSPLCEPCITVDPVEPGIPDELSGVYRFLEIDPECPGNGCSYTLDGQGDDQVYCFGPGPRTGAFECAAVTGGTSSQESSTSSSSSSSAGVSTSSQATSFSSSSSPTFGSTSASSSAPSSSASSFHNSRIIYISFHLWGTNHIHSNYRLNNSKVPRLHWVRDLPPWVESIWHEVLPVASPCHPYCSNQGCHCLSGPLARWLPGKYRE